MASVHELADDIDLVRQHADVVVSAAEVNAALDRMAAELLVALGETRPLLLCVLNGGVFLTSELMKRLPIALEQDHLHATRYGGATAGNELQWVVRPRTPLQNRYVLIVDDILDRGATLKAVCEWARAEGASTVRTAVLVRKRLSDQSMQADYVGVECEDRYLFGCGMDYKNYWRNLPFVSAVREEYLKKGR